MWLGFCFYSDMTRPILGDDCYCTVCYSSQEAGHATPDRALSHHVGPHRKAPGSVRRQREQESMGQSHYWNFHRKEWADGIGQYEQFHRTWSVALPLGA